MALLKPQWAFVWEFHLMNREGVHRTPVALTEHEFKAWIDHDDEGPVLYVNNPRALADTRVDRNVVPLRCPGFTSKPQTPEHEAPNDEELRAIWLAYTDGDIRALILEIMALRRGIDRVQEWFDNVERNCTNKGELGGGNGELHRLRVILRKERERACMAGPVRR